MNGLRRSADLVVASAASFFFLVSRGGVLEAAGEKQGFRVSLSEKKDAPSLMRKASFDASPATLYRPRSFCSAEGRPGSRTPEAGDCEHRSRHATISAVESCRVSVWGKAPELSLAMS